MIWGSVSKHLVKNLGLLWGLILVCGIHSLYADHPSDKLAPPKAVFVKDSVFVNGGEVYFNVLRIEPGNKGGTKVKLKFEMPPNSRLMLLGKDEKDFELVPDKKRFVPVRVTISGDIEGGKAYPLKVQIVTADSKEKVIAEAIAEINVNAKHKWRALMFTKEKFITGKKPPFEEIEVQFENEGNMTEKISLDLIGGEFVSIEKPGKKRLKQEIILNPGQDSTYRIAVQCRAYTASEATRTSNKLYIQVLGVDSTEFKFTVTYMYMESEFRRAVKEEESPLVLEFRKSNILDKGAANLLARGKIFLSESNIFSYNVGMNTAAIGNDTLGVVENFLNSGRFDLGYTNGRQSIRVGKMGGLAGVGVSGWGATFGHRFLRSSVNIGAVLGKGGSWGVSGNFNTNIRGIAMVNGEIAYADDKLNQRRTFDPRLGIDFDLGERHQFSLKSHYKYEKSAIEDSIALKSGLKAEMSYNGNFNKLKLGLAANYEDRGYNEGRRKFGANVSTSYKLGAGGLSLNYGINTLTANNAIYQEQKVNTLSIGHSLGGGWKGALLNLPFSVKFGYSHNSNIMTALDGARYQTSNKMVSTGVSTLLKWAKAGIVFVPSLYFSRSAIQELDKISMQHELAGNMSAQFKSGHLRVGYSQVFSSATRYLGEGAEDYSSGMKQKISLGGGFKTYLWKKKISADFKGNVGYVLQTKAVNSNASLELNYEAKDGWSFNAGASLDPLSMIKKKNATSVGAKRPPTIKFGAKKAFGWAQPGQKYYDLVLVFFKDINGDKEVGKEEGGIDNVISKFKQVVKEDSTRKVRTSRFRATSLISNFEGEISLNKIPAGYYQVSTMDLAPMPDFANLHGKDLQVVLGKNMVLLVPYSKSVTIKGNVGVERSKFSRVKGVSMGRIRVTVKTTTGETFFSLTDYKGNYQIICPFSEVLEVSIANVLGSKFELLNGIQKIEVKDEQSLYEAMFRFKEKGRSINFGKK